MRYANLHEGIFRERLNRFVARVEIDGCEERVHVKNTGRCAELLAPGNTVYLEKIDAPGRKTSDAVASDASLFAANLETLIDAPGRKTAYDLVAVEKQTPDGIRLVNMDSMAPNRAAREWLEAGGLGALEDLRAEVTVGDSRFDFCAEQDGRRVVIEVKGCTLEEEGVARFPDAPTERGVKHLRGLTELARQGCRCVVLIVIQMKGVHVFRPNWKTHPQFGHALVDAQSAGVEVVAVDCLVVPGEVCIDQRIAVDLANRKEN